MPTLYSWLDTSAPSISSLRAVTANNYDYNFAPSSAYLVLKGLLKACLVNGYGTQKAAGWSLLYESNTMAAFKPASGAGVFILTTNPSDYSEVCFYAAESCSDFTKEATFLGGENVWSSRWNYGGNQPSYRHRAGFYEFGVSPSSQYGKWVLVADAETCVLSMTRATTLSEATSASNYDFNLYIGRYISTLGFTGAAEFIVLGAAGSDNSSLQNYSLSGGSTSLRVPDTGLIPTGNGVQCYSLPAGQFTSRGVWNGDNFAGAQQLTFALNPGWVAYNGNIVGRLRGMAFDPTLMAMRGNAQCKALGIAEDINSAFGKLVVVGDYPLAWASIMAPAFFMTTHSDFW